MSRKRDDDDVISGAIPIIVLAIVGVLLVLGASWAFWGNEFFLYRWLEPRREQVRHDTFKQSEAYNEGVAQELQSMRLQYLRAKSKEDKQTIASTILSETADYDADQLPPDMKSFLLQLRQGNLP